MLVALTAGVLATSCVVVFWDGLLARYHLYHLSKRPEYLLEIAQVPEGTPEARAVRKYLETEEGKRALLRFYWEEGPMRFFPGFLHAHVETGPLWQPLRGVVGLERESFWYSFSWSVGAQSFDRVERHDPEFRRSLVSALRDLLTILEGEALTHADHPDLRFTVVRGDVAWKAHVLLTSRGEPVSDTAYVCIIERQVRTPLPVLLEALQSQNGDTRLRAAFDLWTVAGEVARTFAELVQRLRDENEPEEFESVRRILELGAALKCVWIDALTHSDPFVRTHAAWALGRLGARGSDVHTAALGLCGRLTDASEHWYVRAYAAQALGTVGPTSDSVEALTSAAAGDKDVVVRRESIRALGRFGSAAADAAPVLRQIEKQDRARRNREVAAEALAQIEGRG